MKPYKTDLMFELINAMSALNMPDPEHCPPEMVAHAYEHLMAATEILRRQEKHAVSGHGSCDSVFISPPPKYMLFTITDPRLYRNTITKLAKELMDFRGIKLTDSSCAAMNELVESAFKKMEFCGYISEMQFKVPGRITVAESVNNPHYFQFLGAVLPEDTDIYDYKSAYENLLAAVKLLSANMHYISTRPCAYCQRITNVTGEPFGCIALAIKRKNIKASLEDVEYHKIGDIYRELVLSRTGLNANEVECPREKSDMTPCVARDGDCAMTEDYHCVGCGADVLKLLRDEVAKRGEK